VIRKATHTPPRSIRVEEALWQEAKAVAARRGETVTDVITEALRRYVRRNT
jgi:predicted DNA-binding ribbon-helix-helix protein